MQRLEWWWTKNQEILNQCEDMYDQHLLDSFQHDVEETIKIEEKMKHAIMWCSMFSIKGIGISNLKEDR